MKNRKNKRTGADARKTSTTVKKKGILGKVGGFIKKALPVAASFLPGPIGTVAKAITGNDPEWWADPEGTSPATNVPYSDPIVTPFKFTNASTGAVSVEGQTNTLRYSIGEFCSVAPGSAADNTYKSAEPFLVIHPTDELIDTYLVPKIRKVVNAVYLRTTDEYKAALSIGATIYALKKTLEKWRYMVERSLPIMPAFTQGAFPMLTVANKPFLDSAIKQLEEKLRGSIRLPATLCRYLDWRYGRIFRSNMSAKAGLILYDVMPLTISWPTTGTEVIPPPNSLSGYITYLFQMLTQVSQANADIYNTYLGHTQDVAVDDAYQYVYDAKEFVLRTNLDVAAPVVSGDSDIAGENYVLPTDTIIMDSEIDPKTLFMASTVSTQIADGTGKETCLFPVLSAMAYACISTGSGFFQSPSKSWIATALTSYVVNVTASLSSTAMRALLPRLLACKQLDIYNMDMLAYKPASTTTGDPATVLDLTNIDIDTALVPDSLTQMEQKYAFANLMSERAHYAGKGAAANELVADVQELTVDRKSVV